MARITGVDQWEDEFKVARRENNSTFDSSLSASQLQGQKLSIPVWVNGARTTIPRDNSETKIVPGVIIVQQIANPSLSSDSVSVRAASEVRASSGLAPKQEIASNSFGSTGQRDPSEVVKPSRLSRPPLDGLRVTKSEGNVFAGQKRPFSRNLGPAAGGSPGQFSSKLAGRVTGKSPLSGRSGGFFKISKRAKALNESDITLLLKRFKSQSILMLLREVARTPYSRLNWIQIHKALEPTFSSPRECQALWQCLAYRKELQPDPFTEGLAADEDDSDLETELNYPMGAHTDTLREAVVYVKEDMAQNNVSVEVPSPPPLRPMPPQPKKAAAAPSTGPKMSTDAATASEKSKKKGPSLSLPRKQALEDDSTSARTSGYGSPSLRSQSSGLRAAAARNNPSANVDVMSDSIDSSSRNLFLGTSGAAAGPSGGAGQSLVPAGEASAQPKKKRKKWTEEEDDALASAVQELGEGQWQKIISSGRIHDRTPAQLSQRWSTLKRRQDKEFAMSAAGHSFQGTFLAGPQRQFPGSFPQVGSAAEPPAADEPTSWKLPDLGAQGPSNQLSSARPTFFGDSAPAFNSAGYPQTSGTQSSDHHVPRDPTASAGQSDPLFPSHVRPHPGLQSLRSSARWQHQGSSPRGRHSSSPLVPPHGPGPSSAPFQTGPRMVAPGALVMPAGSSPDLWMGSRVRAQGGPDPGVQAAAVAAGARIAPASAAASLLRATQVHHMGPAKGSGSGSSGPPAGSRLYQGGVPPSGRGLGRPRIRSVMPFPLQRGGGGAPLVPPPALPGASSSLRSPVPRAAPAPALASQNAGKAAAEGPGPGAGAGVEVAGEQGRGKAAAGAMVTRSAKAEGKAGQS